jgi:hypothetical protein
MRPSEPHVSRFLFFAVSVLGVLIGLAGCQGGDGGGDSTSSSTTRQVTVTLTDPPTCAAPAGPYTNVWVTITKVRAHTSDLAASEDGGWIDLIDRTDDPIQVDLLSLADSGCLFATLGSTTGLPAGNYQQIRVHLLRNQPQEGEATPEPNACGDGHGFNCVVLDNGTIQTLELSSQATTGMKIPKGQIVGAGIALAAAQDTEITIDFNACSSIVQQGHGRFRLKPKLRAGLASLATAMISGRIVAEAGHPIANATITVLAEQQDAEGTDRVIQQTLANANNGTFSLCALPDGTYDLVSTAVDDLGMTYGTTVTLDVPTGTDMGEVPLAGGDTSPGEIRGQVTATTTGATGADADIALSALQDVMVGGGTSRPVTIPLFDDSTPNVATEDDPGCPAGTQCAFYSLFVPASNPMVGTFDPAGTPYTDPATGSVLYTVEAQAFTSGGGAAHCDPSTLTTSDVSVSGDTMTTAETFTFTGCE